MSTIFFIFVLRRGHKNEHIGIKKFVFLRVNFKMGPQRSRKQQLSIFQTI